MRYSILLAVFWLLMATAVRAQDEDRRLTISGQLLDADLKEPMVQATIQLFTVTDSTFVGGSVSNEKGFFIVEAPSAGTFRLKISTVGYLTIEREVTLRRNESPDLGSLLMRPESILLKEAVIVGRAAQVVVRKDTIMYNPEAFRTPEGSPIEVITGSLARHYKDTGDFRCDCPSCLRRWFLRSVGREYQPFPSM